MILTLVLVCLIIFFLIGGIAISPLLWILAVILLIFVIFNYAHSR